MHSCSRSVALRELLEVLFAGQVPDETLCYFGFDALGIYVTTDVFRALMIFCGRSWLAEQSVVSFVTFPRCEWDCLPQPRGSFYCGQDRSASDYSAHRHDQ